RTSTTTAPAARWTSRTRVSPARPPSRSTASTTPESSRPWTPLSPTPRRACADAQLLRHDSGPVPLGGRAVALGWHHAGEQRQRPGPSWGPGRCVAAGMPASGLVLDVGQGPQVELDDLGVAGQLLTGAGVGVLALVQHVGAVRDVQALASILLDHQDRHAGGVDRGDGLKDAVLHQR